MTNLEGRVVKLEVLKVASDDRLRKILERLDLLEQQQKQVSGMSFGWGGGGGVPSRYLAVPQATIPAGNVGASGDCSVYKLTGAGGNISQVLVGSPILVYNGTSQAVPESEPVPVVQDDGGTWWILSSSQVYIAVSVTPVGAATGAPPGGVPGFGAGNVYLWNEVGVTYDLVGNFSLRNPHNTNAPANRALTVLPTGSAPTFTIMSWT